MKIALAAPRVAASLEEGLESVRRLMAAAAAEGAAIVCFPEAHLPGLRGQEFAIPDYGPEQQEQVLAAAAEWSRGFGLAAIIGMERITPGGRQIAAAVFDAQGQLQGFQTKNQLDPSEDAHYVPGATRRLFTAGGLTFGIAICHEGWRYPETVRWAAVRGAAVVFHPFFAGSDRGGVRLTEWGAAGGPYYERAMTCRSRENTIYFASVNYAMRYQEAATSLIGPDGERLAHLPYGQEGVLVCDIDTAAATGLLAKRYAPDRYAEEPRP